MNGEGNMEIASRCGGDNDGGDGRGPAARCPETNCMMLGDELHDVRRRTA